jgi:hypothetical protein
MNKSKTPFVISWLKLSLVIPASCIFLYFILYTNFVPDAYVFVRYAYVDNTDRTISWGSISNNTFIFDLLIILGDKLLFYDYLQWLVLISLVSVGTFVIKYVYLLRKFSLLPVFIVYLASFFSDLNQIRFNISSIVVFVFVSKITSDRLFIVRIIGFVAHIIPFILYGITYLRNNLARSAALLVPVAFVILAYGAYSFVTESRLYLYLESDVSAYPKILLLLIPNTVAFLLIRRSNPTQIQVLDYALTALLVGIGLFIFNYELTARFFEISFIAICVANAMSPRRLPTDVILFMTAASVFTSRLLSGGISGATFIEQYLL